MKLGVSSRHVLLLTLPAWMLVAALPPAARAGKDEGKGTKAAEEVATEVVEPRRFVETIELDGVLAPREMEAVAFDGDVLGGTLEVVRALGDGPVEKGTVLVQFDDEDARKKLDEAERELEVARLKHAMREQDLADKRAQHELRLHQLELKAVRAEQALQRFLEIEKPERIAQSAHGLEGFENRLQDQAEELEQLEKMYKEDDLTEETEEIVLRRTRRNLARSRKSLEWQRRRHATLLEVDLPEDEENRRVDVRQRQLELASYRKTAPLQLRVAEIEARGSEKDLQEKRQRFEELRADVDGLRLRAPLSGYAVRGAFRDGKWHDLDGLRTALEAGGEVKAGQTLYTIVHPGNVELVATIPEGSLRKLEVGRQAQVRPAVLEGADLPGAVAEIAPVGVGGKHRVVLHLKTTDAALLPGQSAKAVVALRTVENALTVPKSALIVKDGTSYVAVRAAGKTEHKAVEAGAEADGRVEIRSGLSAGDVVVVKPEK